MQARLHCLWLLCCLLPLLVSSQQSAASDALLAAAEEHARASRLSLDSSPWPTDHGDLSRGKFTLNAGLPAHFDPAQQLRRKEAPAYASQWIYTRGSDELYSLSGSAVRAEFVRLDARTLEVKQRFQPPPAMYIGGALIHGNGHVYLVQGNQLVKFENGDLSAATVVRLPAINGGATQTNGMLAARDGFLIIKQWAFSLPDLALTFSGMVPYGLHGLAFTVAACVLISTALGTVAAKARVTARSVAASVLRGLLVGVGIVAFLIGFVMLSFYVGSDTFSVLDFLLATHDHYSNILVIDPDTMQIITQVKAPERCSYARMALYPSEVLNQDYLVTLGDYSVMKWRYSHLTHALELQPQWTERYRSFNDGSFFGTGPAIYNNTVYYTDNTFPVLLGKGYRLYAKSLRTNEPQRMVQLAPDSPGFMFWSVTISPLTGGVIVWDINNNNIQSRSLTDLSLQWRLDVKNMDCLTVAADRGHVYATESVVDIETTSNILFAITPIGSSRYRADRYFLVIDAATGKIVHRTLLASQSGAGAACARREQRCAHGDFRKHCAPLCRRIDSPCCVSCLCMCAFVRASFKLRILQPK